MHLKSKGDPIDVLVIKQNAESSDPTSFLPQCQLTAHNNITLTSTCSTMPGILQGEAISHLHKHNISRTANSGMAVVSQTTETEVTSAIGGSIVTPTVAQQDKINHTVSDPLVTEMSQDDGKSTQYI